jgi:hypothetical protein
MCKSNEKKTTMNGTPQKEAEKIKLSKKENLSLFL